MGHLLYILFIFPLEEGMSFIFKAFREAGASEGLSVLGLSLVVNAVLIPLYFAAEKQQNKERERQHKILPRARELKAVYKGNELYMRTAAWYRINGYHPIMGLRNLLGFLIQVPFFIAAFHFLEKNTALKGASFFFLSDLSRPDALIKFGALSVNLLPFVMTGFNLLSSLVYGKALLRNEKIQLYGIAGLFLILLYNSPSGLVLYWTMNNVFSLVKNLCVEKGKETKGRLWQILKERINSSERYKNIIVWITGISITSVSAFLFLQKFFFPGKLFFLLGTVIILCAVYKDWDFKWKPVSQEVLECFILKFLTTLFILIFLISLGSRIMGTGKLYFFLKDKKGLLLLLVIIPTLIFARKPLRNLHKKLKVIPYKTQRNIYILSILTIGFLLFLTIPALYFYSDPDSFTKRAESLSLLYLEYLKYLSVFILIFFVTPLNLKKYLSIFSLYVLFVFLSYGFIFIPNFGLMDNFRFHDISRINRLETLKFFIYDILILFGNFLLTTILVSMKSRKKIVIFQLIVFTVSLSLFSFYQLSDQKKNKTISNSALLLPPYNKNIYSYSKDKPNIVLLILDAFTGSHMERILKDSPELQKELSGFVWYRNSLASSNMTCGSVPGIFGGFNFSVEKINQRNRKTKKTLKSEYLESIAQLSRIFDSLNYQISIAFQDILSETEFQEKSGLKKQSYYFASNKSQKDYIPFYLHKMKSSLITKTKDLEKITKSLSFFRLIPFTLKPKIYKRNIASDKNKKLIAQEFSTRNISSLYAMGTSSNTNSKKATFKIFKNNISHRPFGLDEECNINYKEYNGFLSPSFEQKHYNVERCGIKTVSNFLRWLKEKNIYDNTRIVIVSDHGSWDGSVLRSLPKDNESPYGPRPHNLFLFKDFNKNSPKIKIDDTFISNLDTLSFLTNEVTELPGIFSLNDIHKLPTRTLKHIDINWCPLDNTQRFYKIYRRYSVKDNIFKKENWTKLK